MSSTLIDTLLSDTSATGDATLLQVGGINVDTLSQFTHLIIEHQAPSHILDWLAIIIPVLAVLLASLVPLFLFSLREYSHRIGELGAFLLTFKKMTSALEKQKESLNAHAKAIKKNFSGSHSLTLNIYMTYSWARHTQWQEIFEAARAVWKDSQAAIEMILGFRDNAIGIEAIYNKITEMHKKYYKDLVEYQQRFSRHDKDVKRILAHYGVKEQNLKQGLSGLDADLKTVLYEYAEANRKMSDAEIASLDKYQDLFTRFTRPIIKYCIANPESPIVQELNEPLLNCQDDHMNIVNLANVYSTSYSGHADYLSVTCREIKKSLSKLNQASIKRSPVALAAAYLFKRGETKAWINVLKGDSFDA